MRVLNATKKSSYLIKAEQLDPDGATIVHLFNDIALMAFGYDDSFLDLKISEPAKKEQPPQFIMPPESTQSETAKTLPNLKVLAIPPLYSSNGMAIGNNNMQFIPLTNNSSSRSYNANNATNFATAPIRFVPVN
jgi:hypothetical protein